MPRKHSLGKKLKVNGGFRSGSSPTVELDPDRIARVYASTLSFLRGRGVPIHDPEYASAVNYGVYKATRVFDPSHRNGRSLMSLAILFALRNCDKVRRMLDLWKKQDEAGACRGWGQSPTPTPIPLEDFEILSFVAAHGRTRAAVLLAMTPQALRDLLDEVALRLSGDLEE